MSEWAIGLMSGTSLDGIDAALIKSDGINISEFGNAITINYSDDFRNRLRAIFGQTIKTDEISELEQQLTIYHVAAVKELLKISYMQASDIDVIGFHGQTIFHDPSMDKTWQLGDGALLAKKTNIDVIYDFRSNDVKHGGEGAPLAPIYHLALAEKLQKPLAFINIGGVANITVIDENNGLIAFDTGTGNGLIDDFIFKHTGKKFDEDGKIAAAGKVDYNFVAKFLSHEYFNKTPPKSLDRDQFVIDLPVDISLEDGAATLCAISVAAIKLAVEDIKDKPNEILICGGGRHNKYMMDMLSKSLDIRVYAVEHKGFNGDAIEAQAFAYMALRHQKNLPISFPKTTGVAMPLQGGIKEKAHL